MQWMRMGYGTGREGGGGGERITGFFGADNH